MQGASDIPFSDRRGQGAKWSKREQVLGSRGPPFVEQQRFGPRRERAFFPKRQGRVPAGGQDTKPSPPQVVRRFDALAVNALEQPAEEADSVLGRRFKLRSGEETAPKRLARPL